MTQKNLIGSNVLGFNVVEKIGSGSYGTVYKVEKTDESGQYIRALKHITIPTDIQYNSILNSVGGNIKKAEQHIESMLKEVVREIKFLDDLSEKNIKNIVRYYEHDIEKHESPLSYDVYILMEYLTSLEEYKKYNELCVRDVVEMGLELLDGIKLCHENNVIHRDIKDDNIFVSKNKDYKLGDFGVSKILNDNTMPKTITGTINFLAPEVYLGVENYNESVDLYSLGIVLYRMLNYGNSPFLPIQSDEISQKNLDAALEERMKGTKPDLPYFGGEEIGKVIVKSISNSKERFKNADEFIHELKAAFKNTHSNILNQIIIINSNNEYNQQSEKTCGYIAFQETHEEKQKNESDVNAINEKFLNTLSDMPPSSIPKPKQSVEIKIKEKNNDIVDPPSIGSSKIISQHKNKSRITFAPLFALVLLVLGILAQFIILPIFYGNTISFIDWLFSDTENIINTLRDPDKVLTKAYLIIGVKIIWWIWLILLSSSLFFVGKRLQRKPQARNNRAKIKGKDPYFAMMDIYSQLEYYKLDDVNSTKLEETLYFVKKIVEKLSIESDFGVGKDIVVECENDILEQICFIKETTSKLKIGNIEKNLDAIIKSTTNINSLLQRRMELKKR